MDRSSLADIDLNLLRVLHVLFEERSVTRTAKRLYISPPAVSKSLQRLRILLSDPLFLRSKNGLLTTPRADELSALLRTTFGLLGQSLIEPRFDPAAANGSLRIAAPEQLALGTIPQLLKCLRNKAPHLGVELLHLTDDYLEKLATGKLDFVINLDQPNSEHFVAHPIFTAAAMIWLRKQHPLAQKRTVSLAEICSYPLVMFHAQSLTAKDFRVIEQSLSEAGLKRNVILDTNHLLIGIDTVINTDAVMWMPGYQLWPPHLYSEVIQRPIGDDASLNRLRINVSLLQHSRTLNSPLHQWIISEMHLIFVARAGDKRHILKTVQPDRLLKKLGNDVGGFNYDV